MRLDHEFICLPLRADALLLAAEVAGIPASAWRPHPEGYAGNSAVPLISAGGDPNDDAAAGAMRPTPWLAQMPYLQNVLAALESVLGRTRLMRLDGNAEVGKHVDVNPYWSERVRVHVPIITHPDVIFHCGKRSVHMKPGEFWIFDTTLEHNVVNPGSTPRIHLVADTVGSRRFWSMAGFYSATPREVVATSSAPALEYETPVSVVAAPAAAQPPPAEDFRSTYTQSFAQLLSLMNATLLVSTYQSGRVILVRADGGQLNTHLRAFPRPMGVAIAPGRLAIGTHREVWEFYNMPALGAKVGAPGKHDAVYIPRSCRITGDVRVHELVYVKDELWFANTRFSSLCTLDGAHSFVPRWRPPFVSALAADDRCHLNGLCVKDDRISHVTVLGTTDNAAGWRDHKADGGAIIEVPSGNVVAGGLSMPHSPRWHNDALWVLEGGKGELGRVDGDKVTPIAQLDGFTRGLAFAGPFAFVGLSQVREDAVFGSLQIHERVKQRQCGVWVIDTRNGATVAFLRFEGIVQEIFDVQVLPARYPELLEPHEELLDLSYALPPAALRELAAAREG